MVLTGLVGLASQPVARAAGAADAVLHQQLDRLVVAEGVGPEGRARLRWQHDAPRLVPVAQQRLGASFGGLWIGDDGRIKLGVARGTRSGSALGRQAADAVGVEDGVDLVPVSRGYASLERIFDWLQARVTLVNAGAPSALVVGIRPDENAVRISRLRTGALTVDQRRLISVARTRFGAAVGLGEYERSLRPTACSYPYCTAPLRAGIVVGPAPLLIPGDPDSGACTGGFIARGRGLDSGSLYQLTAGHCAYPGTWATMLAPAGPVQTIGTWSGAYVGSSGDAGKYRIADDSVWNARPWVYWAGTSEGYPIFSDANPVQGQSLCVSGAYYGTSNCGRVTEVSHVTRSGQQLVRTSVCAGPGDSGAPVHYYGVAYGLMTAIYSACDTTFTRISAAEDALDVDVRHESLCDPLFDSPVKVGDMNADGKTDAFQMAGGGTGYGWRSDGTALLSLGVIGTGFGSPYQVRVGDRDGDGDDDLFQMTDEGKLYQWRSDRTAYTSLGQIASGFGSACDTRMADIDGDGKDDVLRFTNDGFVVAWRSTGTSYTSMGQVATGLGSTYQDRSGDMDGDGDDDLFQITDDGNAYAWLSNGSTYTGIGLVATGLGNASMVRVGDRDGDGDDDLFQFTDGGALYAWRSDRTRYVALGHVTTAFGLVRQIRIGDIDGDGPVDVLNFADTGVATAFRWNGSGYTALGTVGRGFGRP